MSFHRLAQKTSDWMGHPLAFAGAATAVVAWALSGPFLGFSNTWQLIINTSTTVATFLMVFLIQNAQNRTGLSFEAKLDALIEGLQGPDNRMLDIDDLSDEQLKSLIEQYRKRSGDDGHPFNNPIWPMR